MSRVLQAKGIPFLWEQYPSHADIFHVTFGRVRSLAQLFLLWILLGRLEYGAHVGRPLGARGVSLVRCRLSVGASLSLVIVVVVPFDMQFA